MSRRVQGRGALRKGPKLPFVLQQQLGLQNENSHGGSWRGRQYERRNDGGRKSAGDEAGPPRKRARVERGDERSKGGGVTAAVRGGRADAVRNGRIEDSVSDHDDEDGFEPPFDDDDDDDDDVYEPREISRRDRSPSASDVDSLDEQIARVREASPEMNLDAASSSYRNKEAEDDAEILALEKRLGMKGKKSKRPEFDDGFDNMLDDLDDGVEKSSRREEKEWLKQKRAKRKEPPPQFPEMPDEGSSGSGNESEGSYNASFEGFDDEDAPTQRPPPKPRERENPYVAPVSNTAKYIPPSLRKPASSDAEQLQRLKRQTQGCLNKLSEANLISIVAEVEALYQSNPRQDVTDTIIDHLLTAFSNRSALQNTYIILHAAFISALYKIIGSDFGAELICKLVEAFDRYHEINDSGKQCLNLISLLSNLFTFNVITSSIIYDHIRVLLSSFSENTAELLLRIVRDCGPQLRADDPTSLKGIVATVNSITADLTRQGKPINVRTRVMIDTITDLKNNKTRHATSAAGLTGEHITRMRKALGSLNSRQLRATEPLNITRNDIANSDRKGKWWLVGASWKGHDTAQTPALPVQQSAHPNIKDDGFPIHDELNYASLATAHRMNTPTRRSIFTALLTATDARDALTRLTKLRLTRTQTQEIPRVLLRCCRAEEIYNPYYAVIARKLIQQDRKSRMAFSIALWKFMGELGEKQDDEEESDDEHVQGEKVKVSEIANMSRLYASLIARGILGLDVLKTLNVGMTGEDASLFLELLFVTLLNDEKVSEGSLAGIFENVPEQIISGVGWFLRKVVRKSDFVEGNVRDRFAKGLKIAQKALAEITSLDD